MTVKRITAPEKFIGAAGEQPTDGATSVRPGATFYAYDTNDLYITYDGTNWVTKNVGKHLNDDILFSLGNDNDIVMLNRSTTLTANTALANVLEGTPVTPALAANSLIISNITNDGDILIAASDGGHSRTALFFDASAPDTYLYNVGGTWTAGATTWTLPAVTLGGNLSLVSNQLVWTSGRIKNVDTNTIGIRNSDDSAYASLVTLSTFISNVLNMGAVTTTGYIDGLITAANTGNALIIRTNNAADGKISRLSISGGLDTAVATWSNITHTGLVLSGALYYGANQVVGARVVDARADDVVDATYGAEEAGVLDALRDCLISHGLLAAA